MIRFCITLEETELLLRLGGTHDAQLLHAIHNSQLMNSSWPGVLPHVRRWLSDPHVAPEVIRYFVLYSTDEGRKILLDYALDAGQPAQLRKQAIEILEGNLAGCKLLMEACRDAQRDASLAEILDGPPEDSVIAAKHKCEQFHGDVLWGRLIDGLDASYWPEGPPEQAVRFAIFRDAMKIASKDALAMLSGRQDLETSTEWRDWFTMSKPGVVSQHQLLSLMIEQPDLLGHPEFLRRVVPHVIGSMPEDCLPLYLQMLREGPYDSKYWAAHALLMYTDNLEAVPVLIKFMAQGAPNPEAGVHPGEIELLKQRFAVNYFWDVAAWEAWWKRYENDYKRNGLSEYRGE